MRIRSPFSDKSSLDAFSKRGPASDARSKQDREPSFSSRADFTPSRSQSSMSIRRYGFFEKTVLVHDEGDFSDVSLPPMDGLSDEERAHIEAVMASAERDAQMSMTKESHPTRYSLASVSLLVM